MLTEELVDLVADGGLVVVHVGVVGGVVELGQGIQLVLQVFNKGCELNYLVIYVNHSLT